MRPLCTQIQYTQDEGKGLYCSKVFAEEAVYYVQHWNFGTIWELLSYCNAKKMFIRQSGYTNAWSQVSSFIMSKSMKVASFNASMADYQLICIYWLYGEYLLIN